MEKAFQQILTEIYHIVSKKVLDSEDNRPKVGTGRGGEYKRGGGGSGGGVLGACVCAVLNAYRARQLLSVQCQPSLTVLCARLMQIGEGRDVIVIDNAHDDGAKKKGGCCS